MISVDASTALIANEYPPPVKSGLVHGGDKFVGTYTCRQGITSMTLTVDDVGPVADEVNVDARFEFHYESSSPSDDAIGIDGSYRMRGKLDAKTRRLVLKPDAWIEEPKGWVMVGVRGVVGKNGEKYEGTIEGAGCTTFEAKLQSPQGH